MHEAGGLRPTKMAHRTTTTGHLTQSIPKSQFVHVCDAFTQAWKLLFNETLMEIPPGPERPNSLDCAAGMHEASEAFESFYFEVCGLSCFSGKDQAANVRHPVQNSEGLSKIGLVSIWACNLVGHGCGLVQKFCMFLRLPQQF